MNKDKEFDAMGCVVGCAGALIFALCVGAILWVGAGLWASFETTVCQSQWPSREVQWSWLAHCQVYENGEWVPSSALRLIDD